MLAPKSISPKKLTIVISSLVAAIILIVIGFLIYKNFISQGEKEPSLIGSELTPPPQVEINFPEGIFNNNLFKNLKQYIQLPVEAGEQGRTNPFQKF